MPFKFKCDDAIKVSPYKRIEQSKYITKPFFGKDFFFSSSHCILKQIFPLNDSRNEQKAFQNTWLSKNLELQSIDDSLSGDIEQVCYQLDININSKAPTKLMMINDRKFDLRTKKKNEFLLGPETWLHT